MMVSDIEFWVAIFVAAVPLFSISGSLVGFVYTRIQSSRRQSYEDYIRMIDRFGSENSSLSGNLATAYLLRRYPEFGDATSYVYHCLSIKAPDDPSIQILGETVSFLEASKKGA